MVQRQHGSKGSRILASWTCACSQVAGEELSSAVPGSEDRSFRTHFQPCLGSSIGTGSPHRHPLSWPRETVKNSTGWDTSWETDGKVWSLGRGRHSFVPSAAACLVTLGTEFGLAAQMSSFPDALESIGGYLAQEVLSCPSVAGALVALNCLCRGPLMW